MMGFEAETVIQLKDAQLFMNERDHARINSKTELWNLLEQFFPSPSRETDHRQAPARKPQQASLERETGQYFEDGWVGVLGYELNHLLEPSVPKRSASTSLGELYFVRFRHRVIWQPEQAVFKILSPDKHWAQRVQQILEARQLDNLIFRESFLKQISSAVPSLTPQQFEHTVEQLLHHIRQGDIYQANLSVRFAVNNFSEHLLFPLYRQLVQKNPSPFSGIFQTPQGVVLANSPERLVKYNALTNGIETRPIAGTRGRGNTAREEAMIRNILETNPKEKAEHRMLLDLERNDIGKIAVPGTIRITESCVIERYSHVTHIVSQVEGIKASHKSTWDILEAMFPGGTITGCPKVRSMQILYETEPVPRGLYTGSLGYIDIYGNMDFNILIRSLFHWPGNCLHYHTGAGIVADSISVWEYRECLRKAEAIQKVLQHDIIANPA